MRTQQQQQQQQQQGVVRRRTACGTAYLIIWCYRAAQVGLDQCLHHPLMYFPAFYCTRECIERGFTADSVNTGSSHPVPATLNP